MKNRNKNWVLYSGILGVLIGVVILWLYAGEYVNSRLNIQGNFISVAFFSIIIAPFFEEIAFRGYFTKIKKIQIISLVCLGLYVLLFFNSINVILFLLFLFLLFLNRKNERKKNWGIIVSIILFGTLHYQVSDFTSLVFLYSIFIQIGLGAVLLWIVINFGLKRAMIMHALFNFIMLSYSYFLIINKTDFSQKKMENKDIYVVWKKEFNVFPKSKKMTFSEVHFEAENYNPLQVYQAIRPLNEAQQQLFIKEPFISYTISFYLKDSLNVKPNDLVEQYLKFSIENNIIQK